MQKVYYSEIQRDSARFSEIKRDSASVPGYQVLQFSAGAPGLYRVEEVKVGGRQLIGNHTPVFKQVFSLLPHH